MQKEKISQLVRDQRRRPPPDRWSIMMAVVAVLALVVAICRTAVAAGPGQPVQGADYDAFMHQQRQQYFDNLYKSDTCGTVSSRRGPH
jgi:hypothetical protein